MPARDLQPVDVRAAEAGEWADVQAAVRGDGEAYARIVGRYQQAIADYLWRFTRDRVQWEELVQDAFVEAYLGLAGYRGAAPLLHWIRKIATRVGYRYWKQRALQQVRPQVALQDWDAVAERACGESAVDEAACLVHAALAQLAPRDRLVLTLLHLEGCSVAEIAALTGWSQALVKVQAFRARNRLKRVLDNNGAREENKESQP